MLKRSVAAAPTATGPGGATVAAPQNIQPILDDYKYVGFEDAFRGADSVIEERLRAYVPLFEGRSQVLDIGCGRGEMLAALKAAGIAARGIDLNADMVAVARERGLEATTADALTYLAAVPDESLGGVIATQVIEHLEPGYLMRLLDLLAQKLRPASPIVLETINPACWLAFFSSYIRDFTHVRPVHPETLQFLLRAGGFARVEIRYSAPVPDHMKMKMVDLPAEVLASAEPQCVAITQVAHVVNANAAILNNLLFTYLDYAAIGYRS
jgi:O-antigen chain-terminating methyltransferase